jgi:hypothetical protein
MAGREFSYVYDDRKQPFSAFFKRLVRHVDPPIPKDGGVVNDGCELTLPTGEVFQAISYRGDIDGWRQQIELGAKALGVQLARIVDDSIVLDDRRSFKLSDCKVKFV